MNNEQSAYDEHEHNFEYEIESADLHEIELLDNRKLSDEEILILLNIGFDEPEPTGLRSEEWYPNVRALQILRGIDATS